MAKKLFTLVTGIYTTRDRKTHRAGSVVSTTGRDLVLAYPGKFAYGGTPTAADTADADEEEDEDEDEDLGDVSTDDFADELGDVTDYVIYKVGRRYNVHSADPATATVPLNEQPMTKGVTRSFIADLLEGEDDEE